jgi:hypothetical protein
MDFNGLITKYGELRFVPDGKDESGAFMLIDEYKIHVRQDDLAIVLGLPFSEIHPLIDSYSRVSR